jgi:hypothetical protein
MRTNLIHLAWLRSLENEPFDPDDPDYRAWERERDAWLERWDRLDADVAGIRSSDGERD